MQKSRWILQTLTLSVALNAALLFTFFYFFVRDNPLHFAYKPKEEHYEKEPPMTPTLLNRLQAFSFEQLVELLADRRKVEHGYGVRDFALGALASYHDFDVERGLGRGELSKRKWEFSGNSYMLFPRLEENDFELLQKFAARERWPFTPKGMFKIIRQIGVENCDPALIRYFCHTPHFALLETMFARTQLPLQKKTLLSLALESGWESLEAYYQRQKEGVDFNAQTRQAFLMNAISNGSKTAAYLLITIDGSFAQKNLDDDQLVKTLTLLTVKTQEALHFAQVAASSPRSDAVREAARERLSFYTGGPPDDFAGHFVEKPGLKELRPVFRQRPPAAPDPRTHIIQPGESLWIISKKYQVPMEVLMEENHLQSTIIQPGKSLKIPLP
jgi:hypothetical protein